MLSLLNELTMQKELQKFMTNNVFWTTKLKHNNKTENQTLKSLPEPGIEPGTSCTPAGCVSS